MRNCWKIYFYVWLVVTISFYAFFLFLEDLNDRTPIYEGMLQLILDVAGLIGLYGFAWRQPIGSAFMWKVIFIGILFFEVVSWFSYPYVSIKELLSIGWGWMLIAASTALLLITYYIAIFRYGYVTKHLG